MNFKLLTPMALVALAAVSQAQIVFTEDFSTDQSANWSYFSSINGDTASIGDLGGVADFFFDYTTVGIPVAPNGGDGHGLKMQANVRGTGVFSGMSVSPNGQSFSGDYTLRFDAWQNFQGPFPGGGSGTTQLTGGGIAGSGLQWIGGPMNGVAAYATGDGGSASDYRMYHNGGITPTGNYAGGSANNSDPYYSVFVGNVPAAQTNYAIGQGFNNQTGSTNAGVLGMAWHRWEIAKVGTTVTWTVDDRLILTLENAVMSGDNIFLAYSDTNTGSSSDLISDQLLFGVIDNVEVEAVPEPATMAILGLGALAALKRRKKG